jgi:4-amino-4-deoxy-L-arabinose transferase-like glycosyltransferase
MSYQDRSKSREFWVLTLVVAACGVGLSLLAAAYTRPSVLQFDENYYYPLAEKLLTGTFEDGYVVRPPLYPLFLAGLLRIFGTGFSRLLVIESILRGLLIVGIAWAGRRFISSAAGIIAAILCATYPLLIWTYTRFVTEVLYIPLFVLSFYFLDRAIRSERAGDMVAAGLLSGLAALVRSTSLGFTLVVAVWLIVRKSGSGRFSKANLRSAAVLVVALVVMIAPWTVRNAVEHEALIPIDNTAAFNLWLITSGKSIREAEEEWSSWGSQAERQQEGYSRWRRYLAGDPTFHFRRMGKLIPRLYDAGSDPSINSLATAMRGSAVRHHTGLRDFLAIFTPALFWLITAGGIAGIILIERTPSRRSLLLLTVVFFTLLHAMTLARQRFMLPVNVLLTIYAGALICWGVTRLGWTRRGRP